MERRQRYEEEGKIKKEEKEKEEGREHFKHGRGMRENKIKKEHLKQIQLNASFIDDCHNYFNVQLGFHIRFFLGGKEVCVNRKRYVA